MFDVYHIVVEATNELGSTYTYREFNTRDIGTAYLIDRAFYAA